jgi:hypothetical protein
MKTMLAVIMTALIAFLSSCDNSDDVIGGNNQSNGSTEWDIPQAEIFDGGPGKDGIPALEDPNLINAGEVSFLSDNDLVLGYKNGNEVIAYPHPILDWHEIINDKVNGHAFAVTYCPLTGTGIGWNRVLDGQETTFGVSGLLYNSNLIPYDRRTDSNWSQIRLDCVNGALRGTDIETFNLLETTWNTWKTMYPSSKVVSTQTGHSRNYGRYPYGDYRTNNNNIIFPFSPRDNRLDSKERVLGVLIDGNAKVYRFSSFTGGTTLIEDDVRNEPLVIVGNEEQNFIVAFMRRLDDGTILNFSVAPDQNSSTPSATILTDSEGNHWNVFGEAVSGPRSGQKLSATASFIGFWFSWGAFYPGVEIHGNVE